MEYIKVSEAAEKWGLSPRRVRLLCAENRIDGVIKKGKLYMIPENAPKPVDGNGRCGRLLLNLDLIQNGYPAINVKFADRKRYYNAFDEFYRNGNAEAMTELIGEYVKERLQKYLNILI